MSRQSLSAFLKRFLQRPLSAKSRREIRFRGSAHDGAVFTATPFYRHIRIQTNPAESFDVRWEAVWKKARPTLFPWRHCTRADKVRFSSGT
jgi:hypothetical protein